MTTNQIDTTGYTPEQQKQAAEIIRRMLDSLPNNRSRGDAQARATVAALADQIDPAHQEQQPA